MADKVEEKTAETKAEKFARLAVTRVNKALDAIALLRGLSNKNNYEYTDEQATKIVAALEGGVVKVAQSFKNPGQVEATGFTL